MIKALLFSFPVIFKLLLIFVNFPLKATYLWMKFGNG